MAARTLSHLAPLGDEVGVATTLKGSAALYFPRTTMGSLVAGS
jgi:hypothetical protein